MNEEPAADVVPKPNELLALHDVTTELFDTLREWFDVPESVTLDLGAIDAAVTEMSDPMMVAALAMRKLQALHLLSTPGVRTTTDIIVTIVQDLDRALVQAPSMRLRVAAQATDWDAALAALDRDDAAAGPAETDAEDPEATRFRHLHGQLHAALVAVVEASEGQIRYLE